MREGLCRGSVVGFLDPDAPSSGPELARVYTARKYNSLSSLHSCSSHEEQVLLCSVECISDCGDGRWTRTKDFEDEVPR